MTVSAQMHESIFGEQIEYQLEFPGPRQRTVWVRRVWGQQVRQGVSGVSQDECISAPATHPQPRHATNGTLPIEVVLHPRPGCVGQSCTLLYRARLGLLNARRGASIVVPRFGLETKIS